MMSLSGEGHVEMCSSCTSDTRSSSALSVSGRSGVRTGAAGCFGRVDAAGEDGEVMRLHARGGGWWGERGEGGEGREVARRERLLMDGWSGVG